MKSLTLAGIERPLSVLCLGTANYGSAYSREQSFVLLDATGCSWRRWRRADRR